MLRTNARLTLLQAMLRYRELLQVEDLVRQAKSTLRTRPIYHSSDAAIRGHVFCSFLPLVLQDQLPRRCRAAGFKPEWSDVLRDLDRLQQGDVEQGGKTWTIRTEVGATAATSLRACGIAVPPRAWMRSAFRVGGRSSYRLNPSRNDDPAARRMREIPRSAEAVLSSETSCSMPKRSAPSEGRGADRAAASTI